MCQDDDYIYSGLFFKIGIRALTENAKKRWINNHPNTTLSEVFEDYEEALRL